MFDSSWFRQFQRVGELKPSSLAPNQPGELKHFQENDEVEEQNLD